MEQPGHDCLWRHALIWHTLIRSPAEHQAHQQATREQCAVTATGMPFAQPSSPPQAAAIGYTWLCTLKHTPLAHHPLVWDGTDPKSSILAAQGCAGARQRRRVRHLARILHAQPCRVHGYHLDAVIPRDLLNADGVVAWAEELAGRGGLHGVPQHLLTIRRRRCKHRDEPARE